MNLTIENIVERIQELENDLEQEFAKRREAMEYRIERNRVIFKKEVIRKQKQFKTRLHTYILGARPLVVLTAPFIYAVIIPFLLLDIFVSLYQFVCFPVYGIKKVCRSNYITFDRGKLAYLNGIEKFNCIYCSYGNGLIAFVREIASRTEQYWCPIKHAKKMSGHHNLYPGFTEYGDAEAYRAELENLRKQLAELKP